MGIGTAGLSPRFGRVPTIVVLLTVAAMAFAALRQPAPVATPAAGIPSGAQVAVVDTIVDGDTLWVRVDQAGGPLPPNQRHKIRLLEIDTPETQAPGVGVECGGPEATAFIRRRLPEGAPVHLVADREDTDQYGRFLRYAWTAQGDFFNLEAVRTGHARVVLYEPNDAYIAQLRAAQAQARAAGRGIWGEYCPAAVAGALLLGGPLGAARM